MSDDYNNNLIRDKHHNQEAENARRRGGGIEKSEDNGCAWILVGAALAVAGIWQFRQQILTLLIVLGLVFIVGVVVYLIYRRNFEYKEFVRKWSEGYCIFEIDGNTDERSAKAYFWQHLQAELLPEIQKLEAEKWQVAGIPFRSKVGPKNFKVARTKKRTGLLSSTTQFEPIEFHFTMKRPKVSEGK